MKHLLLLVLLSVAGKTFAQADTSFSEPDIGSATKLTLWATQYFIHRFESGGTIPIVDATGKSTGLTADTCNFCEAALEGTAYVTDSSGNITVINFAKSNVTAYVDCRKCARYANSKLNVESWGKTMWTITSGFGNGVKNYRLVPYRTIAVDPNIIPYGTVIYIPQVRNLKIEWPDGTPGTHDGYFFAGDTGGAIKGNHIDVFTGVFEGNPFPEVVLSNEQKTFEAYVITDQGIVDVLKKAHQP
jgi:3D (Asp-Asp-Asp) domain-containing protein